MILIMDLSLQLVVEMLKLENHKTKLNFEWVVIVWKIGWVLLFIIRKTI